jgi:hypothetical protein
MEVQNNNQKTRRRQDRRRNNNGHSSNGTTEAKSVPSLHVSCSDGKEYPARADSVCNNEHADLKGDVDLPVLARRKSDVSDDVSFEELVFTDDESDIKASRRSSSADDIDISVALENVNDPSDVSDTQLTGAPLHGECYVIRTTQDTADTNKLNDDDRRHTVRAGSPERRELEKEQNDEASTDSNVSASSHDVKLRQPTGVTPLFFANTKSLSSGATYLDQSLLNKISPLMAYHFGIEHRLFIRAVIDLLYDRDIVGVEANIDDPNTLKSGKLKKASAYKAGWKTKYVELRMGNLTSYDDDPALHHTSAKRRLGKHILLRGSITTCRAVSSSHKHPGSSNGFVFELRTRNSGEPSSKRYFMTHTQKERQEWIRAIHESTIGGLILSPLHRQLSKNVSKNEDNNKGDLDEFLSVQQNIRSSKSEEDYRKALASVMESALTVPVVWVKEHVEAFNSAEQKADPDGDCSDFTSQFWRNLRREVVSINGFILDGSSGRGTERIVGALTRCILDFDRSNGRALLAKHREEGTAYMEYESVSEVQAICYARDILLSCFRGDAQGHGDAQYCVDTLCSNPDLITLECQQTNYHKESDSLHDKALAITVSCPELRDVGDITGRNHEQSGWITCRSSSRDPWRSRFCVLSDGNFTYFEREHPSPHGLLEQLDLSGATIGISEVKASSKRAASKARDTTDSETEHPDENSRFLVVLVTRDRGKERQLCFDNRTEFLVWREALEVAFKGKQSLIPFSKARDAGPAYSHTAVVARKRGGLFRGLSRHANSPHIDDLANRFTSLESKLSQSKSSGKVPRGLEGNIEIEKKVCQGHSVEVTVVAWMVYKICPKSNSKNNEQDALA